MNIMTAPAPERKTKANEMYLSDKKLKHTRQKKISWTHFPSSYASNRADGTWVSASFSEFNCQEEALCWRWDSTHIVSQEVFISTAW